MLYAKLWEEDRKAKCQREEMEAAMQLERNMEMLKVSLSLPLPFFPIIYINVTQINTFFFLPIHVCRC